MSKEALGAGGRAADRQAAAVDVESCVSAAFPGAHHRTPAAASIPLPAEAGATPTQTATDTACPFFRSLFVFLLVSLLLIKNKTGLNKALWARRSLTPNRRILSSLQSFRNRVWEQI